MKRRKIFNFLLQNRLFRKIIHIFTQKPPKKINPRLQINRQSKFSNRAIRRKLYHLTHPRYSKSARSAMAQINSIRKTKGLKPLSFDARAQDVARARLRDMRRYRYFGHYNPRTNKGANHLKENYGFYDNEYLMENLYSAGNMHAAIRAWMDSSGHRENLLGKHSGAAIVCDKRNTIFIGIMKKPRGTVFC